MRIVPQINVFSVSIQFKMGVGIAVVVLALPAIGRLIDSTLGQMFDAMLKGIQTLIAQ